MELKLRIPSYDFVPVDVWSAREGEAYITNTVFVHEEFVQVICS